MLYGAKTTSELPSWACCFAEIEEKEDEGECPRFTLDGDEDADMEASSSDKDGSAPRMLGADERMAGGDDDDDDGSGSLGSINCIRPDALYI